ncbi:MAG: hypothetical protein QOI83_5052 [Streptomycetaceae bacterium]|nr:hypothetical protein [Streptomycetaceae bacterium]
MAGFASIGMTRWRDEAPAFRSVGAVRSGSRGVRGRFGLDGEVEHLFGRDDVVEGFAPVDRRA